MAIADTEPKKNGEETSTGVTEGSFASVDTAYKKTRNPGRRSTASRSYSKIKDFGFSIPEGWSDAAIVTFLDCCKENIEDLKNHIDDENMWCNIARSGAEISKRFDCFTVNNCIELGQSLKSYIKKYKDRIDSDEAFKQLYYDVLDLLPYFSPVDSETKKITVRSRSKSSENKTEPTPEATDEQLIEVALENLIVSLGKQYSGIFGAKGSTPDFIWREMSRKVAEKLGIKIDVKKYLEAKKRQIANDVLQETDTVERESKFLVLAQDYISYFDYIPPRSIKISDFCVSNNGQQSVEDDTDIATDATVELTEEEGETEVQNNRLDNNKVVDMEEMLVSNNKEKVDGNSDEKSDTTKRRGRKLKKRRATERDNLLEENDTTVDQLSESKSDSSPVQNRKSTLRGGKQLLENKGENKDVSEEKNKQVEEALVVSRIQQGNIEKVEEEEESTSSDSPVKIKRTRINYNSFFLRRALPKRTVRDKVDKIERRRNRQKLTSEPEGKGPVPKPEPEPKESIQKPEVALSPEKSEKVKKKVGRKRKFVSNPSPVLQDEEFQIIETGVLTPRGGRYLSRARSRLAEPTKTVRLSKKDILNKETTDSNSTPNKKESKIKNKESSMNSSSSHPKSFYSSPKLSSTDSLIIDSDTGQIKKNPFVRLSPVPHSCFSQITISEGNSPCTLRIPEQMGSAKTNQETKKASTRTNSRTKAKLMEERVAVPKDVVKTVYNPSSDSAKTKIGRLNSSPRSSSLRSSKNILNDDLEPLEQLDVSTIPKSELYASQIPPVNKETASHLDREESLMQLLPAGAIPQPCQSSAFCPHSSFLTNGLGSNAIPPKWFDSFTMDYKKHEAWKISQLMKMQNELVSIEKKKISVLQNILTSLSKH